MRSVKNAGFLLLMLILRPGAAGAASGNPPYMVPYGTVNGEPLGDQFGNAVAGAGDVNGDGVADVLVGDNAYNGGRGRAYLYPGKRSLRLGDLAPPLTALVTLTGENAGDNLGYAVASGGDVNGDGFDDIVVGAPNYSVGAVNRGRAYVYFGGPSMDNVADLTLTGEGPLQFFGYSVAGAGDLNHDGYDDFVVGAYGFASGAENQRGRVYVYFGGPTPDGIADRKITGRNNGDRFGFSVATAGDVNGDGTSDLLVGAPGYSSLAGRGYLFFGSANPDTLEDQVYTGQSTGDWFGTSVSTAGDTNDDGYADIVIGAPNRDFNRGYAYVYLGAAKPSNVVKQALRGENPGDYFGLSVAGLGDCNRDGRDDVIVGAPGYSSFDGNVYIYWQASSDSLTFVTHGLYKAAAQNGWSVAGAGDVDGDGCPDAIYGQPGGVSTPQGAATVLSLFPYRVLVPNGGEQWVIGGTADVVWYGLGNVNILLSRDGGASWTQLVQALANTSDPNDGYAVAFSIPVPGPATTNALIRIENPLVSGGAPAFSDASDAVFQIADPATPPAVAVQANPPKIYAFGTTAMDAFGSALAGGDWNGDGFSDVAIGASSSSGTGQAGRVSIYFGGAKADGVADLTLTGQNAGDFFGGAVAFPGDLNGDGYGDLVVGAPGFGGAVQINGKVYVYFGGPMADGVADFTITGTAGWYLGHSLSGAGDVNHDGVADLLAGSTVGMKLYLGDAQLDSGADLTLLEFEGFACSSPAGDVNGDGYADFILGAPSGSSQTGRAYVYYGGVTPDGSPDLILQGIGDTFGSSVTGAGDVNGDGYSDVAVGEPGKTRTVLFFGGPSLNPAGNLVLTGPASGGFGTSAAMGYVNGDAYADLLVGEPFSSAAGPGAGRVQLFFGGPGMNAVPDITIANSLFGAGGIAGYVVAMAGDFLGDGFGDLLVGAPGAVSGGISVGGAALYDVNVYQLSSPNGGETWPVGASKTISWYGTQPANVLLSVDGGNTYTTLASNVGGKAFNSLGVLVPHAPTKFARMKLVPSNPMATPPNPILPPSLVTPPNPVLPPSPVVSGADQSDSLFTINASVSLLSLLASPAPEKSGAVITWNTDPGPADLAGYRLEKAIGSGAWKTLVGLTKETKAEDPAAGPATRYRLFSVNGLHEELFMGETSFRPRASLAAWPLPYRGGELSIAFATSGGLGGNAGPADVGIFDVQGRLVRRVAQGVYPAGYQSATWDGRDARGRDVASGVYLIRSLTGGAATSVKLVVAR